MITVKLSSLELPDWGWHYDDREESAKLMASLRLHGQLSAIVVYEALTPEGPEPSAFTVLDGRRRLAIMRQLDWETCFVVNLGLKSKVEAIKVAMSLELAPRIDYAELAKQVAYIEHAPEFTSLPMTTPFTLDRLRYMVQLTEFDWAQYAGANEQALLYDDDDAPRPAPKPVSTTPEAKPVQTVKPVSQRPAAASNGDDVAARRAARTAWTPSTVAMVKAAAESLAGEEFIIPAQAPKVSSVVFMGDDAPEENLGWRPEPPPQLDGIDEIELDTETTGLRWWAGDRPIGISIKYGDKKQYLPWGHTGGNLDEAQVKEWAKRELRGKRITNVNMRFDNHMLYQWGVDLDEQGCTLEDPQHWAALLDEYRKEFGLDILGRDFLGQHKTGEGLDKTRMASYHASQVEAYACQDVHLVAELKRAMVPLMDAQDLGKVRALEGEVIYPVCEMERNAAYVDKAQIRQAVIDSGRLLDEMLFEVSRETGFQVNPDKNADLVKLFAYLHLAVPGHTEKGNASFADALLEKIDNDIVQKVRRSGKLASLRSKFLIPYSQVVGDDNRLRFALHQLRGDEYGTVRGRFSMSGASKGIGQFGANLQQVFRVNSQRMAFGFAHDDSSHDHEIFLVRGYFEAEPYVMEDGSDAEYLSADAQSIEYRLAAHFAEATQILKAYEADQEKLDRGDLTGKWVDFHKVTGDMIRPYKDLSRNIVKNANFCLVYGGGKPTLASTLGMESGESDMIHSIWHRVNPELSALPRKAEAIARKRGYVKTILGRRARFRTAEELMWAHAAVNYVIQGSAADIMKMKLVELHKARKYTGLLMRMTVHDEVGGDARMRETAQRVREILNRQSFKLKAPIVWEVETGKNWAVAH